MPIFSESGSESPLEVYIHVEGSEDPSLVALPPEGSVIDLLEAGGAVEADMKAWLEDASEPLDAASSLSGAGVTHRCHVHCGRCDTVKVQVRFNGEQLFEEFSPADRIKVIYDWATGPKGFKLPEEQIPKHGLIVPGGDHILAPSVHIGSLASDDRCVALLDLVPRKRFEG